MSTSIKNNSNNSYTVPQDKNKNRFYHVNEIINYVSDPNNDTTNFEEIMGKHFSYNVDNYRIIWDALKYVLLDQNVIKADDELFQSNSKRGRTKGSISISQEAVYCESILELARKTTGKIDYNKMLEKYGYYATGTSSNAKSGKNKRKTILPSEYVLSKIPDANEDEDNEDFVTTEENTQEDEEQEMQINSSMNQSILDVSRQVQQDVQSRYGANQIAASLNISSLPTFSANTSVPNISNLSYPNLPQINYGVNPNQSTNTADSKLDQLLSNQTSQFKEMNQQYNNINQQIGTINSTISKNYTAVTSVLTTLTNDMKKVKETIEQHTKDIEKLNRQLQEQPNEENLKQKLKEIEEATKKSTSVQKNLDTEIKKALDTILPNITKQIQDDITKNPALGQRPRAHTTTTRRPTAVWGTAEDSINDAIPRVYSLVAQRIPKDDVYSCDWFKRATQEKFTKNGVPAEILSVEILESKHPTAKTKALKVLVKGKENLDFDKLYDAKNWVRGVKVTRFNRPRSVSARNNGDRNNYNGNGIFPSRDNRDGVTESVQPGDTGSME